VSDDEQVLAVGYVRVSTGEQVESGAGLQAQREAIRAECHRRGWVLAGIEEDAGASGKSTERREALQRALAAVEDGGAKSLVVAKLDRLARSMGDFVALLERSRRNGWALVSLDLGLDTGSPMGEFTAHIIAAVAQLERRLIGQRTREALAVKRAEGVRLGRPGTIEPLLAARIVGLRAEGLTLEAIAAVLNDEGVPTPRGGVRWRPSSLVGVLRGTA
jgi:DNA invertase Pin-like site-specific DNA recombinase